MKKLLTTLALTLGLLLGGLSLAPVAHADDGQGNPPCDSQSGQCADEQPCDPTDSQAACDEPPACTDESQGCDGQSRESATTNIADLAQRLYVADQTVQEYRVVIAGLRSQVASLDADVARLHRVTERQAATIQRLRAKVRALR